MRHLRLDGVAAGQHPRAQVALVHRRAHGPIAVRADRRANREERDAARAIELEQLQRIVERAGGEQVHLAAERQVGEQRRGGLGRRADGAAEELERIGDEPIVVVGNAGDRAGVAQHAALQVPQAPAELGLVAIVGLRRVGGRGANGGHRRFRNARRVGRTLAAQRERRSAACRGPHVHHGAARRRGNRGRCTRTRYGPGGNCFSVKFPVLSETANAVVPPSADTTAPSSGLPSSSVTLPSISPVSAEAMVVTGWNPETLRLGETSSAVPRGTR